MVGQLLTVQTVNWLIVEINLPIVVCTVNTRIEFSYWQFALAIIDSSIFETGNKIIFFLSMIVQTVNGGI